MKPERTKEKYTFYKSNRDGEADVFYNGHALPNLPYHVAEELCTAANNHYKLLQRIKELESQTPVESKLKQDFLEGDKLLGLAAHFVTPEPDGSANKTHFTDLVAALMYYNDYLQGKIEETKENEK